MKGTAVALDMIIGGGASVFSFVWYCIGNGRVWATRPCEDTFIETVNADGSLTIVTIPDHDCCDNRLWWWTEGFFVITYVLLGIGVCCLCCMAGAMSSPQFRDAAERMRRGENPNDVYADLQRQAAHDVSTGRPSYSSDGSEPVVGRPVGAPYQTEKSPLVRV